MLIEFFGQNYGCFRDEFRLSMVATDIDPQNDRGIVRVRVEGEDEPLDLLRAAAIYGPNASGKSTILRAADALGYLIGRSSQFASDQPLDSYEPFALGPKHKAPVMLGVTAVVDAKVYSYRIEFDATRFLSERLVRLNADESEVVLIDRTNKTVSGTWTKHELFALVVRDFRRNALLLSLADQFAPGLAENIAVGFRRALMYSQTVSPLGLIDAESAVARRVQEDGDFRDWLLSRLRAADVGVSDLRAEAGESLIVYSTSSTVHLGSVPSASDSMQSDDQKWRSETKTLHRLSLLHDGVEGTTPLAFRNESLGTQRIVELAPLLYDLAHGRESRTAFVDELDASLHPVLLNELISQFNGYVADTARGQLIFATHETSLLDDEAKDNILRRDQVYFTEKYSDGAAKLYSLAEFKERNNLNIRRRYLHGRYGALPALGVFSD